MIQFLKFNEEISDVKEFTLITGRDRNIYFLKKTGLVFLFIYSTLFLAVALPFVKTPFMPIYFFGAIATSILIVRFVNNIIMGFQYNSGKIKFSSQGVEITDNEKTLNIPVSEIKYFEVNILGNLVLRSKNIKIGFPIGLLTESSRDAIIDALKDMSPKRTALFFKVWEFIDAVVVALVLAVHIIQYIVQAYFIPTGSMMDTLLVGDHLFVEKITFGPIIPKMIGMDKPVHLDFLGIRKVQKGDVIIFRPPHEEDKDYIKRCIAIPGDRFDIKDGFVYINDKKIDEPYVKGKTEYDYFGLRTKNDITGTVPDGKVVVLGDNRENSQDGRYFGYLDIERIKGKAFILYWNTEQLKKMNLTRFGFIK
jgi:signal peptidase I